MDGNLGGKRAVFDEADETLNVFVTVHLVGCDKSLAVEDGFGGGVGDDGFGRFVGGYVAILLESAAK